MNKKLTQEEIKKIENEQFKKSSRQDNKQHCQKILEGINKFDNYTANRAIWELVQNPRDLSKNAEIDFILNETSLCFSHKGIPFNYETFTSLIKQVSSSEKENSVSAGQFGTGFMTTHKFSRLIKISGSLEITKGHYAKIENFELNRTANNISSMIEAMTEQLSFANHLKEGNLNDFPEDKTSFIYELDEEHFPAAKQGIESAFSLIPYVMVFNKRIAKISITDNTSDIKKTFIKGENKCIDKDSQLYSTIVCKDLEKQEIFYLKSEDEKDIIVLPLISQTEAMNIEGIPRLFIYFPLLGTHDFGINYIFHSERFYPEEPRNAIVLPDENLDKREKYEANVKVFYEMLEMLYLYLSKKISKIEKSYLLAPISINPTLFREADSKTKEFYNNLKDELVSKFSKFPFISVGGERVAVSQRDKIRFLSPEITNFLKKDEGKQYFDVVYSYANQVSTLPAKEEILEWSEIVEQWNLSDNTYFVTIEDIVNTIVDVKDECNLLDFLNFLKDSGQNIYFQQKALIPNREGELKKAGELRNAQEISSTLYDICKYLITNDTSKFVNPKYVDIYEFTKYGRDDLRKSINEFVNTEKSLDKPFEGTIGSLIDYCSIFPIERGTSVRNTAMPIICQIFKHNYSEQYVKPLDGVETDTEQQLYRTAFEVLVNYVLKYIEQKGDDWYVHNQELHFELLSSLCNKERPTIYQTKTFLEFCIIPNQEQKFSKKEELKVLFDREIIPEEIQHKLFEIYNELMKKSYRAQLVNEKYSWMLSFEEVQPKSIGREIEDFLKENNYSNTITITILDLLDEEEKNVGKKYWSIWFENIYLNKANIFLNRLQGEERNYTYKFMKTPSEKKAKISELIDNPNFDIIISKGVEYVQSEQEKQIVSKYMQNIGKIIENKLGEEIKNLLRFEYCEKEGVLEVNDIQNGQDIIIRKDEKIIYYIEVKTKWNFEQPAHMSTNQMRQAVLNPDCYALCCVDLTAYSASIEDEINEGDIIKNTYVHLDIGSKLGKFLKEIVNDKSDEETNLKISNYQSNFNKGFFKSGQNGLSPLIEAIIKKAK